jgi:WD40 repeat protein
VGCSAITLRKLEAEARRPSKQIAERLAEVLNIPPEGRAEFLRFARGDPFAAPAAAAEPVAGAKPAPAAAVAAVDLPTPLTSETTEAPAAGPSPFKGLRYFDESDAQLYFGRAALIHKLVARLRDQTGGLTQQPRFLAVVGASGSGKSSVVRAGLIPALKQSTEATPSFEHIVILTPTAHPVEALATALTHEAESVTATATLMDDLARDRRSLHLYAGRLLGNLADRQPDGTPGHDVGRPRLLLVVDQFEELFTLCRGEAERQAFVDNLLTAAAPEGDGPVCVVVTLRADFYAHCAAYAGLRDALASQQEYIGPMTADELRQAIELPASQGRWAFEPGLVDLILRDVGASDGGQPEPGALPLLSHALLETWRHRRGRTLTLKSYAEAGRVQGAIATTAEAVFQSLAPEEQAIARNIFLRLTELGEGTQDTRRRVALVELLPAATKADGAAPYAVAAVLKTLSDARLITEDAATVEVAHEALIREWPTLRQWLSENRDGLRQHRHLTEAAQEWDELNRDPSELYRGPRLAEALERAEWSPHSAQLNALELEFLQASQALAEREAAEREAQRQRELDSARQLTEAALKVAETEKSRADTERRAASRLRLRNAIITVVGVVAVIAAIVAALFSQRSAGLAADNAAIASAAQASARLANSRELALSAISNLTVDPQRSLLLALQAVNLTNAVHHTVLPEAAGALHWAVLASHLQLDLPLAISGAAVGVAFSRDGNRLAVIDQAGTASMWDVTPGQPLGIVHNLPSYNGTGIGWEAVAFSPDGTRLATASEDVAVTLWDAASGKQLQAFIYPEGVQTIAFSPDGKRIAAGGNGQSVVIWDIASGQIVATLCCADVTQSIAFSPDGLRLATANHDSLARVWEVATGHLLQTLVGHKNSVSSIAFSPDWARLATASYDGTVRVWAAGTGQQVLLIPTESPYTLAFSPDGKRLATGGQDGVARVWDAATGQLLYTRLGHTKTIFDLAFSPDGTRLATAGADATVKVWDAGPDRELVTLQGGGGSVFTAAFSRDGTRIVTGGLDKQVRVWDTTTGQGLAGPPAGQDVIRSAVFSPDGKQLATASEFSAPNIWDTVTGALVRTLSGHNLGDWSIAFSPDGTRLATASLSGSTTLWDAASGEEQLTLPDNGVQDVLGIFFRVPPQPGSPYQRVARAAFSPDGRRIVTSGFGLDAHVWGVATGQQVLTLHGHTDSIQAVTYSPDGLRIATASMDGTARVWDAATSKQLLALSGHTTGVLSVAFSPDGKWLATGSLDNTAKLWDAQTGQLLQNLPGPAQGVTSVAFSPDGERLLVASLDGTTRLYELKFDNLLALAKTRVTRPLTATECQQYLHGPCPGN